jgi:hypothetical protein
MAMQLKMIVAGVMLGCCSMAASAQMDMDHPPAAVGTMISPAKAMDEPLTLFEHDVVAVAKAMPADKYNFTPMSGAIAGSKFDGVRSFASEVKHVTEANYFFYTTLSGMKPDMDRKKIDALTSKDEIVKALEDSFAFAHKAIATITPENAFVVIKGVDGQHTRASLAALGAVHGYDHYGQMVEYLRMNGVVPPGSK